MALEYRNPVTREYKPSVIRTAEAILDKSIKVDDLAPELTVAQFKDMLVQAARLNGDHTIGGSDVPPDTNQRLSKAASAVDYRVERDFGRYYTVVPLDMIDESIRDQFQSLEQSELQQMLATRSDGAHAQNFERFNVGGPFVLLTQSDFSKIEGRERESGQTLLHYPKSGTYASVFLLHENSKDQLAVEAMSLRARITEVMGR